MKISELPAAYNEAAKQTQAQCPKCGAFSGGDWSQCEGFCPVNTSPHFSFSTEITYSGLSYEKGRK